LIPAPKTPRTLPVVLSPAEVIQFLECVKAPKHRTILTTCYAAWRSSRVGEQQYHTRAARGIGAPAAGPRSRFELRTLLSGQHQSSRRHAPSFDLQVVSTSH
jgi:hypothetical protein